MSLQGPAAVSTNPLRVLVRDLRTERRAGSAFPAGETRPSLARTRRFAEDPLSVLLEAHERYGPVFTLRIFHGNVVWMLGPEANHRILVSHAGDFSWREGHMRDLIGLLGDGLLTIDGEFHRRSRQIMLPAFHRERIAAAHGLMAQEAERAVDGLRVGQAFDLYPWTRRLALRIAMSALLGVDPDGQTARSLDAARLFEQALGFYAEPYTLQVLRGPRTPWARMRAARARLDWLIYSEIARRRRSGERGEDLLSLLLDATDEDGASLSERQVRDEVMTLLFAGHDTTTSTVAFMVHELSRHPEWMARLQAEQEGRGLTIEDLGGEGLPQLELALAETLRLYPPAWVGPRRALRSFEFAGARVPAGAPVNYSSWVSHRLAHVFPDPSAFRPERFAAEARAALPKGAYVPFGGGSRMCIGMRFGQLEVRTIVTRLLARFSPRVPDGYVLRTRQMPTIGPREGMPVVLEERAGAPAAARAPAPAPAATPTG